MASNESESFTVPYRRRHEPIEFSRINILDKNNIQLVWIDEQHQSDYLSSLLQNSDLSIQIFDNMTSVIDYILHNKDTYSFFVIASGKFGKETIEKLEHLSQILYIFIYCSDTKKYEDLKEKSWKLITITDLTSELIKSIENAQKSVLVSNVQQHSVRDLSRESAIFIWFQLLKRLAEKLTTENQQLALDDLKKEIKDYAEKNKLNRISLLANLEQYVSINVIWLYTREGSISKIINEALRQQNIDLLYKYRHFIRDLSDGLAELRITRLNPLRVYRGCVLSKDSFNNLKYVAHQQRFISTLGYFSTSHDPEIAKVFSHNDTGASDSCDVSVMFEIDIMPGTVVIAADISAESYFPEEREVLFDLDSVFKIVKMTGDENNQPCTIHMETSNYGRELANGYLRYNEKEMDQFDVALLFGRVIADMGEYEKSIKYYEKLLDKSNIDQVDLRIHLGHVYTQKGDYKNAYKYYNEARQICYGNPMSLQNTVRLTESNTNSKKMAEITYGLGWLDDSLGDSKAAVEKYQQSLELYETSETSCCWQMKATVHTKIAMALAKLDHFDEAIQELTNASECMKKAGLPDDHPDISQNVMNIGEVLQWRGDYDQAEQLFKDILEKRKRTLPPGHLDIAKTLYRLGSFSGQARQNFEKALDYLHQALVISGNAVGELHPTTALIWSGIANVYLCQNDFQMALTYQLKALELYENIYNNRNHEDTAKVLNNIGELSRRMKNYEKALEYFGKSLKIRQALYGDEHIEIGTANVNLAETYRDMGHYETALQHAERGMYLWKQKLSASADYMKEGEELLNELRTLVAQNNSVGINDE